MSEYGSVFRSPSYWVALLAGVGGIALAARQESMSGSMSRPSGGTARRNEWEDDGGWDGGME